MKNNFRRNLKWFFLAWLVVLIGFVLWIVFAPATKATAWEMAQHYVREELKAPGATSFGSEKQSDSLKVDDHVESLGNGSFRATGFVYTQNQFGGNNKSEFTCELHYLGHGNWERTKLSIRKVL
jgi:hypothetical protein